MTRHEKYIKRCLQLAEKGIGLVSPNPLVGCVIVENNEIIGEGYHQKYGEAHAEVNAINSVKDSQRLQHAELYVSLEPCSHQGKTPPCVDLIIRNNIPRVIICNEDPNPLVAGSGIQRLKDEGIEVITAVLENEGKKVNRRFFTFHQKKRPYILLKWAQSQDGFLDKLRSSNVPAQILSDELNSKKVHRWRSQEDAIWVGKNTLEMDNPALTVRHVSGRNPIRISLDKQLSVSKDINFFNEDAETIVFNYLINKTEGSNLFIKLQTTSGLEEMLNHLFHLNIQSILVEGGSRLLKDFIKCNLWDEAIVSIAKDEIHVGVEAPVISKQYLMDEKQEGQMNVMQFQNYLHV